MHPNVHFSIIYNIQDTETTQVPIHKWMEKKGVMCIIYVYMYTYIYCI